jgi:hypothetical protein
VTSVFALVALVLLPAARAQPDGATSGEREARALFGEALDSLRTGDDARGRELLERSLALYDAAPTRFNLAIAYRTTGDALRSVTMLEEMLEGRHGELSAEQRAGVSEQLALSLAEIAFLAIRVRGADRARVFVDGEERGVTSEGFMAVRVDPGEHRVAIATDAGRSDERESRVERGERASIELEAPRVAPIAAPRGPIEPPEEGSSLDWLWITLGAVAAVGAGIALTLVLLEPAVDDPIRDPVTGLVVTLGP